MKASASSSTRVRTVGSAYAIAFDSGCVEFWSHNPSILTKRQIKQLGILGIKKIEVAVNTGEGLGR